MLCLPKLKLNCAHIRTIYMSEAVFAKKYEPDLNDPKTLELHKLYRPERVTPTEKGYKLISTSRINKKLLDDPLYIGLRRNRVRGPEYTRLLDNFMKAVTKKFGRDTLIQFEDFAFQNAYTLLDRYKNEYCTFNDDIQGTAAIVVAGLIATTRVTKVKLSQSKIVFLGAGASQQ
ncbi:Malic enzyme [Trichostrongylus colubriformis]|uniref:Malic enzyme n=1 Tax=Trichostrongylus colubriformis TaxID=6319 RepID=A0AAN8IV56_TRICO